MGNIVANGVRLHYVDEGEGPETIVFSHSYVMNGEHFRPQIDKLKKRYRCLAFDHRCHGGSELVRQRFEMEEVYLDAVDFIEALDCGPCHFVGLSTGGFCGLRIAIRRPELLKSLTLMDTSADPEPDDQQKRYKLMMLAVRLLGTRVVAGQVLQLLFGKTFLNDPLRRSDIARWRHELFALDDLAVVRFGEAIFSRQGVRDQLDRIVTPTQVIVGDEDLATPVSRARRIADGITGAELIIIPKAGHISPLEQPDLVNEALEKFIEAQS